MITTVKELINELKKYPPNIPVEIECTYDGGYKCGGRIQELEIMEGVFSEEKTLFLINLDG